jgi:hypothetical protein
MSKNLNNKTSWLRTYATSRKFAESIPDDVNGFVIWSNPASSTIALVFTQPQTETSNNNLPAGGQPAGA